MGEETYVKLNSVDEVKRFVNIVNEFNFNVNLVLDGYCVDAKSIIGIFSLDLTDSLKVQVETKDPLNFFERIKEFIVKKWKYSSNKILHYLD